MSEPTPARRAAEELADKLTGLSLSKGRIVLIAQPLIAAAIAEQAESDADIARLKAWLTAHESLWQAVSGSPVDIVLLILHQLQAENERLTAEVGRLREQVAQQDQTISEICCDHTGRRRLAELCKRAHRPLPIRGPLSGSLGDKVSESMEPKP